MLCFSRSQGGVITNFVQNTTRTCKEQSGAGGTVLGQRHWPSAISPDMRCGLSPISLKMMCIKIQWTNRHVSEWCEKKCGHVILNQHILVFKTQSWISLDYFCQLCIKTSFKRSVQDWGGGNGVWHWYCELIRMCLKTYRAHQTLQPNTTFIIFTHFTRRQGFHLKHHLWAQKLFPWSWSRSRHRDIKSLYLYASVKVITKNGKSENTENLVTFRCITSNEEMWYW